MLVYITANKMSAATYDHRLERTRDPVRSPIFKLKIGRLVVEWVTISEYLLLYVLLYFYSFGLLIYPNEEDVHFCSGILFSSPIIVVHVGDRIQE